jgi:hypothetical protein
MVDHYIPTLEVSLAMRQRAEKPLMWCQLLDGELTNPQAKCIGSFAIAGVNFGEN